MNEQEKRAFLDALMKNPYDEVTHRVFADWLEEHGLDDEAVWHREWTPKRQKSYEYMCSFAEECSTNYDVLMQKAQEYLDEEDYFYLGVNMPDCTDNMDSFWEHYEVLTGRAFDQSGRKYKHFVACSC